MTIEVQEVNPRLKGEVHILHVVLNISCMRVVMYFEYQKDKWVIGAYGLTSNSQGEKGERKRIEKFIKSEKGQQKILNHNQIRLHTVVV